MVYTHIKSVSNVSNLAWDILKTVKHETLQIFENNYKEFNTRVIHTESILTIRWDSKQKDDDDDIRICAEVLMCNCNVIKDKQIGEILLDQRSSNTQNWCDEIEAIMQAKCCLFIPVQNKVLVYCNTYDDLQKVKHHFQVKEGTRKPTCRSNSRNLVPSIQPSGAIKHVKTNSSTSHECELLSSSEDYYINCTGFANNVKTFETKEGIVVKVYESSIVNLPVDCIVNSTDEFLLHDRGISKIIKEAAGEQFKSACDMYLEKNGAVPVGHTCTTIAGQLPNKLVIHAVGPHDLDNVNEFEKHLYLAIICSLFEAEKIGMCSIAIPPIGTGISDEPEEHCIYQYTKAVVDYSRTSLAAGTSLREIHFVDKQPGTIRKIQHMFTIMIQDIGQINRGSPNDSATACRSTAS